MEEEQKASPCRYIALDIHKYYSVVAGVDREGKEILAACRVEHLDLENWLGKHLLQTDRVVIESTTCARRSPAVEMAECRSSWLSELKSRVGKLPSGLVIQTPPCPLNRI